MEDNYKVYMHITPSAKIYIGITKQSLKSRWSNGLGYRKSQYFYNAIKKYGWENIYHGLIIDKCSKEEALELESYFINLFDTTNRANGYNRTTGGEHAIHCEEVLNKLSNSLKGRKFTEEHKQKLSLAKKGKKQSEELVRRRVEVMKANGHYQRCKPPRYAIEKSMQICCKPIYSIDDNGEIVNKYPSLSEAARNMGVKPQSISSALKKKSKSKGYYWQYAE